MDSTAQFRARYVEPDALGIVLHGAPSATERSEEREPSPVDWAIGGWSGDGIQR